MLDRVIDTAPMSTDHEESSCSGLLAGFGSAMRRNRKIIVALQWSVVVLYLCLLIGPVLLPIPPRDAHVYNNLRLFAQFLFWGIWWPFVMVGTMSLGRVWCGVFCPEGSLTEFASRHGQGRAIPHWMRWGGWPLIAFIFTTVFGQLIGVYKYPTAALLILGGSSAAAITVGYLYGREKRVWCRYLCPANGVFSLLAKIAPLHFHVDQQAWKRNTLRQPIVNCAPLIDIRHMKSASACHACGRCSDYKGAVTLAARWPAAEIIGSSADDVKTQEALTLLFGIVGIATAALLWSSSSHFNQLKSALANWLIEHDSFALLQALLQDNAPWWLLTHYPAANDVFSWLDGLCILIFLLGGGAAVGLALLATVRLGAWVANHPGLSWQRLSLSLMPLAGAGLFLGLSMLTLAHLKAERIPLEWVPPVRIALLAAGSGFSAYLLWKLTAIGVPLRRACAFAVGLLPIVLIDAIWIEAFFF